MEHDIEQVDTLEMSIQVTRVKVCRFIRVIRKVKQMEPWV